VSAKNTTCYYGHHHTASEVRRGFSGWKALCQEHWEKEMDLRRWSNENYPEKRRLSIRAWPGGSK
jgi:hypothetical protein